MVGFTCSPCGPGWSRMTRRQRADQHPAHDQQQQPEAPQPQPQQKPEQPPQQHHMVASAMVTSTALQARRFKLSVVEHRTELRVENEPTMPRKCGIVCTLGPKTTSLEMITKLHEAGMNIARLNFAHGTHDTHRTAIENIRKCMEHLALSDSSNLSPVAIALDTQGPKIRTGSYPEGVLDIEMRSRDVVTVTTDPQFHDKCTSELLFIDYPKLATAVAVGNTIHLDDGLITLKVTAIEDSTTLTCLVVNPGTLGPKKGVNLPGVSIDLPAVSEKDREDIQFGVDMGVDIIFASFVRGRDDVLQVRECLGEKGEDIFVLSKIESVEGVVNFDEILSVSDGIMVARGDLGVEIAPEKVFLAQKMMIAKCNMAGKPVICATQMLDSMTHNPRPTRAEVSDVANAVLDGSDCVMLSSETATGQYPIEAVTVMSRICREAEHAEFHEGHFSDMMTLLPTYIPVPDALALAAAAAAMEYECSAIITITNSGQSLRLLTKYRPTCPIIVVSRNASRVRQAHLHRGCYPFEYPVKTAVEPYREDLQRRIDWTIEVSKKRGLVKSGSPVVIVHGADVGSVHYSLNQFHVRSVP